MGFLISNQQMKYDLETATKPSRFLIILYPKIEICSIRMEYF